MTIGAIGVILLILDKIGAIADFSDQRVAQAADSIAREAMRQDGLLLAQLLSTDALDSRAAPGRFRAGNSTTRQSGRTGARADTKQFSNIADYYLNRTSGRMVILGAPGSGKTVLAVTLTVELLKRRAKDSTPDSNAAFVPCLLNLPSWEPARQSLPAWLEAQIADRFRITRKVAARLVSDGWILPVLDGLDEMDSDETTPRRSQSAVSSINDYIARIPDSHVVVVCRSGPKYYERLVRGVRNADEIVVQNLEATEIIDYVEMQCSDELSRKAWLPVFQALRNPKANSILSVLDTPWRMTAAVTFALLGGDPSDLLPTPTEIGKRRVHSRYSERVSGVLMQTFITARLTHYGSERRKPSPANAIKQLRIVAHLLKNLQDSGTGGTEIVLHQWCNVFGDRKMRRILTLLTGIIMVDQINIFGALWPQSWFGRHVDWTTALAVSVNLTMILLYGGRLAALRRYGPVSLRVSNIRAPHGGKIALIGTLISGSLAAFYAVGFGVAYGIGFGVAGCTLVVLIASSTGLDPIDVGRPAGPLVNDLNFAILTGCAFAAYSILYYVPIYGLPAAVMLSSCWLTLSILASSYIRYFIAACIGFHRGLPLRFARFLNWCYSAGILRASGIGYQFRHQEVLDYLLDR